MNTKKKKTILRKVHFLIKFIDKNVLRIAAICLAFTGVMMLTIPYVGEYNNKVAVFLTIFGIAYSYWLNRDIQYEKITKEFAIEIEKINSETLQKNEQQDKKIESLKELITEISLFTRSHAESDGHSESVKQIAETNAIISRLDLRIDDLLEINKIKDELKTLTKEIKQQIKEEEGKVQVIEKYLEKQGYVVRS